MSYFELYFGFPMNYELTSAMSNEGVYMPIGVKVEILT